MTELLRNQVPGDPVPVFLPAWSWDPRAERLSHWITRSIARDYPELSDDASYGPTAIADLVGQGQILPIIDGIDALPPDIESAVPCDGQLMSLDRLVITCRSHSFDDIDVYTVIAPQAISADDARRFLCDVIRIADPLRKPADRTPGPALMPYLSEPRMLFLAGIVYRDRATATKLAGYAPASASDAEERLVELLIPATMNLRAPWARSYPRYATAGGPQKWLGNLARLDLRDPADGEASLPDDDDHDAAGRPEDGPERGPRRESGNSRITWWNLYRGVGHLRRWQALERALIVAALAFIVMTFEFRYDRNWQYSLMTAGGYAVTVLAAGAILGAGPWRADRVPVGRIRRATGPQRSWLGGHWGECWRLLTTALLVFCAFGALIGLRTALENADAWSVGSRTGLWDGLYNAIMIVFAFVLAGVPRPPRTSRAVDTGQVSRRGLREFLLAICLGVPFGLLWGGSYLIRYQGPNPPALGPALVTGTGTGLFFGLGCWIFARTSAWFRSLPAATPRQSARLDLAGTIVGTVTLGLTFAFAFGVNVLPQYRGERLEIHSTGVDVVAWFIVGASLAVLGSEWPLYLLAVSQLAGRKKVPLRLLRFMECCRASGVVRVIGHEYQIHDDRVLRHLLGADYPKRQAEPERRARRRRHGTMSPEASLAEAGEPA
jgi:hypothetical protein